MNVALWILQVLLGLFFVFHFFVMVRPSPGVMKYTLEIPAGLRLFAGIAEGLAGLALVIPPLLHVLTWLTPLAAASARSGRGAAVGLPAPGPQVPPRSQRTAAGRREFPGCTSSRP